MHYVNPPTGGQQYVGGTAIGISSTAKGTSSVAIGANAEVSPTAFHSITLGSGVPALFNISASPLINNIPQSLMIGFNSDIPTFTVRKANGNGTTGNVGIGTTNPVMKFQVDAGSNNGILVRTNHTAGLGVGLEVDITHDQTKALMINKQDVNGQLRTNFLVWGSGDVWAREFHVTLDDFYDYVFDDDYQLMPLPELEQYLIKHKHLPDIPSATEIKENGMSMAEMEALLVKKVEELTLYVIRINKENEELKKKMDMLTKNK